MHNPFKAHKNEHIDTNDAMTQLFWAIDALEISVRELREEVDYMIDFLDTDD